MSRLEVFGTWPSDDPEGMAEHLERTRQYVALSGFSVRGLIEDRYLQDDGMLKRGTFLLAAFGVN